MAALQRAILALHSHRTLAAFRRAVAGIFLEIIPAGYFSVADARIDPVKKSFKVLDMWESRPVRVGAMLEAFERTMFDHPFVTHMTEYGPCGALMISDFMTLPRLRRTRLYQETMRPADFGRSLSIGSRSGPGIATLNLTRPESARDFTERDRLVLELMQPHFDQARTNIERETAARANRSASLEIMGLTPRQIEVALWLAQGKTNPEIALIVASPVRTVEKHVEHILRKLEVGNRVAAAVAIAEIVGS